MASSSLPLLLLLLLASSSMASAAIVEHSFTVQDMTVRRLCRDQEITAVNSEYPGPTIHAHDGDVLVVHVSNKSPYDLTIHWHGIFQLLSAWADGPENVTQCPIRPGGNYTYKFKIKEQEGTLWWHAHSSWLRATVHGALLIRPKNGRPLPYPKPYKKIPILLGEWWNANVVHVEEEGLATGSGPNISDAYTINGLPGNLYPCSQNQTYTLKMARGKTYLLQVINAALNNQFFFKLANHNLTVVAVDAVYTDPYVTDVIVLAPGQTTDVLVKADQPPRSYYMAARPYADARPPIDFSDTITRAIVVYDGASPSAAPLMPTLPSFNDTPTAHKFYTNITSLVGARHWVPVPRHVDHHMFVTFGLNLAPCGLPNGTACGGPNGQRLSASMNNVSFVIPNDAGLSMLEAYFHKVKGVYSTDFPDQPPVEFDYTNSSIRLDNSLIFAPKATSVKKLKFNSTVEMVLQNTAFVSLENHPMHLHGFNFHVLAQGFGNYDPIHDPKKFNFLNPQIRNTIAVPVAGWAVIRFQANNPGVWLMHCHLDVHVPWGLAMGFEVENGPTPSTWLPPPPHDLPKC
ncbi:laccase-7-like [Cucurbita moschata]|uniref:Laccase n=1 Tax=Cucurbita moschata TaxID=3662 RepID=A0A6J1GGH4_CUCMO|nr:laccase-7-like [Cucurbita moschata]